MVMYHMWMAEVVPVQLWSKSTITYNNVASQGTRYQATSSEWDAAM